MERKIEKKEIMATMLSTIIAFTLIIAVNLTPARAQESPIEVWSDYTLDRDITFSDDGFIVKADNVTLDLNGHTITGSGEGIGIHWDEMNGVVVKNGEILNFHFGIYLSRSSDNIISGTNITNNIRGIYLFGSNNVLRNNCMSENQFNFEVFPSVNDVDTSNTVKGRPICYWVDERDKVVPVDSGFVALVNCTRITAQDLSLTNNGEGILLAFTTKSTIAKNDITNNTRGIYVFDSSDNNISGNNIENNDGNGISLHSSSNNTISGNNMTRNGSSGVGLYYSLKNSISGNSIRKNWACGIEVESSSNNTIVGNDITGNNMDGLFLTRSSNNNSIYGNNIASNQWSGITIVEGSGNTIAGNNVEANAWIGIYLSDSTGNIIYHNDFVDNTYQVSTENSANNIWDNGYPSGGNYWSDHVCTENPSDGSQSYIIDEANIDHYPFQDPNGWLLLGDINNDGVVDIFDVVLAANAFSSQPGDFNWNQAADLNNDDVVDIFDIVLLANNFGKTA